MWTTTTNAHTLYDDHRYTSWWHLAQAARMLIILNKNKQTEQFAWRHAINVQLKIEILFGFFFTESLNIYAAKRTKKKKTKHLNSKICQTIYFTNVDVSVVGWILMSKLKILWQLWSFTLLMLVVWRVCWDLRKRSRSNEGKIDFSQVKWLFSLNHMFQNQIELHCILFAFFGPKKILYKLHTSDGEELTCKSGDFFVIQIHKFGQMSIKTPFTLSFFSHSNRQNSFALFWIPIFASFE